VKRLIKRLLPRGRKQRRILGGICRGLTMSLDLESQLQRYLGLDEREIAGDVWRLSANARTLVDVGANDGYYTMAFLNSEADRVIACEPGDAAKQLMANAAMNGHLVSDRFQVERRLIGTGADAITLAKIIEGCPRPIFFKIDVDGAEVDVLQSIETYPHLHETSWMIETHSPELEQECVEWFDSRNFRTRIISPAPWRRLIPEQRVLLHNRWLIAEPA
jgi:hypothetical protein